MCMEKFAMELSSSDLIQTFFYQAHACVVNEYWDLNVMLLKTRPSLGLLVSFCQDWIRYKNSVQLGIYLV